MRVLLVGSFPPPWGGIAVHVRRLAQRLHSEGHAVRGLDLTRPAAMPAPWPIHPAPRGLRKLPGWVRDARWAQVMHVHTHGMNASLLAQALAVGRVTGTPVVASVHSFRQRRRGERTAWSHVARRLDHVVASGPDVYAAIAALGLTRLVQVPPFVAPPASVVDLPLPPPLEAFLAKHQPVIAAGAAGLRRYRGQDLYGLDQLVAAAPAVLDRHPRAGFVFLLPRVGDASLLPGPDAPVRIHQAPLDEAATLWARADVFVRPTLDDGDSVSVREALALGVRTVASDVVGRPVGCVTYAGAGTPGGAGGQSLARTILEVLDRPAPAPVAHEGYDALRALYDRVLAEDRRGRGPA